MDYISVVSITMRSDRLFLYVRIVCKQNGAYLRHARGECETHAPHMSLRSMYGVTVKSASYRRPLVET